MAWSLFGLSVVMAAASIALLWAGADAPRSALLSERSFAAVDAVFLLVPALVGTVIAAHAPRNVIGWLMLALGLIWSVSSFTGEYAFYGLVVNPRSLPAASDVTIVFGGMWTIGLSAIALVMLLFPDGRLPSRRWWPAALISLIPALIFPVLMIMVWPHRGLALLNEDLPASATSPVDALITVAIFATLGGGLLAVIGLITRFRRGNRVERQQIKWLAIAGALLVIDGVTSELSVNDPLWRQLLSSLAFLSIPVAIGLAVFRYRLYDVDHIINRAIVYFVLTAILAAGYIGTVLVLQSVLPVGDRSPAIVATSTLAMAALFRRARRRIQDFVDRRFYRSRFDATRTLESFGARLRSGADLDEVTIALTEAARTTMQPAHLSMWLRPPEGDAAARR